MRDEDLRDIERSMKEVDLHPTLAQVVEEHGLDRNKLTVALRVHNDRPDVTTREEITISDGTNDATWTVPSLRALFRGERKPPEMSDRPPPAYMPVFWFIERHIITFCDAFGDTTDQEFEGIFNQLRRRPDGKTTDDLHAFLWQVAAVLAGTRPLSAAEYEAILNRLRRSARTFSIAPVSRNYIKVLQNMGKR